MGEEVFKDDDFKLSEALDLVISTGKDRGDLSEDDPAYVAWKMGRDLFSKLT